MAEKFSPVMKLINGKAPPKEPPPRRQPENRSVDICIVCNKEDEMVGRGMCRNCFQVDYRQREKVKVKYAESRAMRKQKRDVLKVIHALVLDFDRAEELGVMELLGLEDETENLITNLTRKLVELQQKIVGKSDDAIVAEALRGIAGAADKEPN